ncbi:MAG: PEP/pyruvate-binding domain-containing protein, partial [Rhabdochlamydiaceae bacterium]
MVRSSATREDGVRYSFAGLFDTVLDVKQDGLLDAIKEVYASLCNIRAVHYFRTHGLRFSSVKMAVIVQKFVETDVAGVVFTENPMDSRKDEMVIEYVEGRGEALVSGRVAPARIMIDRKTLMPKRGFADQKAARKRKIGKDALTVLLDDAIRLERVYEAPLDIEWGMKGSKLYIFQARPITTGHMLETAASFSLAPVGYSKLKGTPISSGGVVEGRIRVIEEDGALRSIKKGDVVVTKMTHEDALPWILEAGAIIAEYGGLTSHAAIVAREYGIPCIVGVNNATSILKNNGKAIVHA